MATPTALSVLAEHARCSVGAVLCIRFNPTGHYLLTAGKDRSVRLWNASAGRADADGNASLVHSYTGAHAQEVRCVCANPDSTRLASAGADRGAFVWDVRRGCVVRRLRGHDGGPVNDARFAGEGGAVVVTGGYDQTCRVWDCRSTDPRPVQVLTGFRDAVTCVADASGRDACAITAGSADGSVRRYDVRNGGVTVDRFAASDGNAAAVADMALGVGGEVYLASCLDGEARLVDAASGEHLTTYRGHVCQGATKLECALTRADAHAVVASEDGRVLVYDLVDASVKHIGGRKGDVCVSSLDYAQANGGAVAAARADGTFAVYGMPR